MNTIPEIRDPVLPAASATEAESSHWRQLLGGEDKRLQSLQRRFARLPSAPRCGICCAPFGSWGGVVSRIAGRQPASDALTLCRQCQERIEQNPGFVQLHATIIRLDFRRRDRAADSSEPEGAPANWERQFYRSAAEAVDRRGGIVERCLGGGLVAFFIPWRAGADHAGQAIVGAQDLFAVARENSLDRHGVQIAVGLHTGLARIGAVPKGQGIDFGAVGPAVTTAGQLAAAATAGEALVSLAAWRQHGGPVAKSRHRTVPVPGALQPVEAIVVRGDIEATL